MKRNAMKRDAMKSVLMVFTMLVGLLAGCQQDVHAPAETTEDIESQSRPGRIEIPPTIRSNLGLTFADVERREVANTIRVPGAFELQPLARHEYRMTLPGRIELLVDQYDEVESGDPLYRFRSPQWSVLQREIISGEQAIESARGESAVAREKIVEAKKRLESMRSRLAALASAEFRQAELEAQAAELEASIPRMEAELRLAETRLANARRSRDQALHQASTATNIDEARLTEQVSNSGESLPAYRMIDWIEVQAAERGTVQTLHATDGSYVEPPSVVLSTVDPSQIRFRAMGLQSDLPRLSSDAEARIVPPRTPGFAINDGVAASLTIGLEAHPDQRTVTLLATPKEKRSWMRPGVSAFLEVVVESSAGPALAIPRSAIVKDGITHVFFRRDPNDPNTAIRVEADMGVGDGRWVAINSGLAHGDEVVLDGAYELKLASEQSGVSQKGGHMHADGTFHAEH